MTVTIDSINRLSSEAIEIKYSSDLTDPTFTIYKDSVLYDTTSALSVVIRINSGESPVIAVIDDGSVPTIYPKHGYLTWWSLSGAVKYRIEEYINSAWVIRDTINESGKGFYTWKSRVLEDCITHTFRIIPIDEKENDGTEQEFDILMVRIPGEPDVEYSYSSTTKKLTIT